MADTMKRYQELQEELNRVREELESLEQTPEIRRDLEFKSGLEKYLDEYGYAVSDIYRVMQTHNPGGVQAKSGDGPKRQLQIYTNPHTGEVVKTRGGNQKRLKEWREEYGAETVRSWRSEG